MKNISLNMGSNKGSNSYEEDIMIIESLSDMGLINFVNKSTRFSLEDKREIFNYYMNNTYAGDRKKFVLEKYKQTRK